MGASGEIAEQKRALRARLRAARDQRPRDHRARADRGRRELIEPVLAALPAGATVASYLPVGSEPGLVTASGQALADELTASGHRVLLPIVGAGMALDWAVYEGPERLTPSRFGLLEPTGPRIGPHALAEADLVVVPAMAVDHLGARLGKGAGCYDGALPHARPGVPLVAVLDDDTELVERVPAEPHDRHVTHAVTPTRLVRLPTEEQADRDPGTRAGTKPTTGPGADPRG